MKYTSKHFAWSYLLRHGTLICETQNGQYPDRYSNGRGGYEYWSYYGGRYKLTEGADTLQRKVLAAALAGKIDWNKTSAPRDEYNSEFEGTDCDSAEIKCFEGVLVLRDGTSSFWGIRDNQNMDVFEMMAEFQMENLLEVIGE